MICKIKLNARKSVGCFFSDLLITPPELLRGIWVSQTAALLRVHLLQVAHNPVSAKAADASFATIAGSYR